MFHRFTYSVREFQKKLFVVLIDKAYEEASDARIYANLHTDLAPLADILLDHVVYLRDNPL